MRESVKIGKISRLALGAAPEGSAEPLEILHGGDEDGVPVDFIETSVACPAEAVLILRLRKDVLASDAQLAADRVAMGPVGEPHAVTRSSQAQLLSPRSIVLQIEGPALPRGQLLQFIARLERSVGCNGSVDHLGHEAAGAVASICAEHFDGMRKSQPLAAGLVLVEQFQGQVALYSDTLNSSYVTRKTICRLTPSQSRTACAASSWF
jgi:hypothetical protein